VIGICLILVSILLGMAKLDYTLHKIIDELKALRAEPPESKP
jgi:hypothetical protein